jgi:hypothetical protein
MGKITSFYQHKFALSSHSIEVSNLENATLHARERAIKTHKILKSKYLYQTGGWKDLFGHYTNQTIESEAISQKSEIETNLSENDCVNQVKNSSDLSRNLSTRQQKKSEILSLCPSTQPDKDNPVIFGVVEGTVESPKIAYLTATQAVTEEVLALSTPAKPTEIFRMASTCQESGCKHFDGNDCRLVKGIVDRLPSVVDTLPACQIRPDCRWWQQEGKSACFRCPQIVTDNYQSSDIIQEVANPNNYETES